MSKKISVFMNSNTEKKDSDYEILINIARFLKLKYSLVRFCAKNFSLNRLNQ